MTAEKRALGDWGEELAAGYLRRHGYTIVARNVRSRYGEIDIIARRFGVLAFVEVKLRKNDRHGEAKEFVTPAKQRRVMSTALLWLGEHETELSPRFDVIEIYASEGRETRRPVLRHLKGVFEDTDM